MKYLITGGCGFLGANLAYNLLDSGKEVFIFDNLSREGSFQNLNWLREKNKFEFYDGDIRSYNDVEYFLLFIKPDVIFHLAGQVAMTTSIENPRKDFEINVIGGHNLLEVVRKKLPETVIIYSSTNKVYGDLEYLEYEELQKRYIAKEFIQGFDESLRLDFHSPYGCSKGTIDQYMLDYARIYGLKTIVFRHSSIFGGRQFVTFDQGWVGWFIKKALEIKKRYLSEPFTISGNGKQVRDIVFIDDLVKCYLKAIDSVDKTRGQAFNIGGGIQNSLSLLELFDFLEEFLDIKMIFKQIPWRASDQKVFIADYKKATTYFHWNPEIDKITGIKSMIEWMTPYV